MVRNYFFSIPINTQLVLNISTHFHRHFLALSPDTLPTTGNPYGTTAPSRMYAVAYEPRTRYALTALIFLLLVLTLALDRHAHYTVRLNACYIHRAIEKPAPVWIPLGDGALHNYSVYIMWTAALMLALLPNRRAAGLYSLLYSSLWFHQTYVLLAALKSLLTDYNCAGRHLTYPNGISGHYCYFLYVTLTLPRLALSRLASNRRMPRLLSVAVTALISLYVIGASATLYRTFAHGYHSMRQIFLGSALGFASHLSLEVLIGGSDPLPMATQLAVLLTNSALVFTAYYSWWPAADAGHAIPFPQVYFHAALYVGLFASAFFIRKKATKTN